MMSHAKVSSCSKLLYSNWSCNYHDYYAHAIVGSGDGRCTCSLSFAFAQLALEKYVSAR